MLLKSASLTSQSWTAAAAANNEKKRAETKTASKCLRKTFLEKNETKAASRRGKKRLAEFPDWFFGAEASSRF